ncbi:protein mor1 [Phtheirospermum japonicum]|uniref:Protein mor1 n=2 Tax=Magnoliopsida TaxID=3398 RepID=A0A830DKC8_9LAMI|nr:protein mor1 [Phtheirospermum japonicum]
MSEDEKLLKEAKKLPWEDRLTHKNWKVRNDANIDLAAVCDSISDPKDPRLREFGPFFRKSLADSNAPVQEKALDALIAFLKAADADVGRYAKEVCEAIVAKCLTGRPKTVEKAQMAFMLWVELEAVEPFLDAMEKAIKNKVAKAVVPAIDVMFQALSEFGSKVVPPKRLLKMLPELFDHQDQNVRASSKGLTLELCRWIGKDPVKSILFEKMRDTMVLYFITGIINWEVESRLEKMLVYNWSEQDKEPEPEAVSETVGSGPAEESVVDVPQEIDEYELVDPVDILTPLEKSGFWEGVKATKWSERKEAVAELTKLASTKRIAPGDFSEVCRTLKKLITDVNIAVAVEAIQALGNLARGLRTHFSASSRFLLPVLLEKLKEKKPTSTEALTQTLQAMHKSGCLNLNVKTAVKNKVPLVRSMTLNWVTFCIDTSNKATILKVHKEYVPICMESLNDGTPDVRDAAFSALAAVAKMVGMRPLEKSLEKLDDVRKKKLSEMIVGSTGDPSSTVPSSAAVQSSGGSMPGTEASSGTLAKRSAASMLSGKKPINTAPAGTKKAASGKSGTTKKGDGGGQSKVPKAVEQEDVEPAEMSLEEIETRLGSLIQVETITQMKSSVWKERLEAIVSFKEQVEALNNLDSSVEILIRLLCVVPGWNEKNVQVQQQVIEIIAHIASTSSKFPKKCVVLCLSGITERVADIKTRAQAMKCLTTFCEAVGPGFVSERMYKIMKEHKNPKVLSEGLSWMVSAVEDFGVSYIKLKDLIDFCKDIGLQSSAAATRNATVKLIGVLHKFVGPDIKAFLSDVKPALLSTLDAEYEKNPFEGAAAVPKKTVKVTDSTPSAGGVDGLPREDISEKITPTLLKGLESSDWKIRLESIESVNKILEEANKRIQPTGTGELFGALRSRLHDSNKNLIMATLTTIGALASAMGQPVEKSSKGILSDILKCLGDNKKNMRECTLSTLDSWLAAAHLDKMVPYVTAALTDAKVGAEGRRDLFDWLSRQLAGLADFPDAIQLLKPTASAMTDKSADVRKAAETCFSEILRVCGQEMVSKNLRDIQGSALAIVVERLKPHGAFQENFESSRSISASTSSKSTTKSGKSNGYGDRASRQGNRAAPSRTAPTKGSRQDAIMSVQDITIQSQALFNIKDSNKDDRERMVVRRFKFEEIRLEQIQDLENDVMRYFREDLHRRLLSTDFKKQVDGIEMLQKALPSMGKEFIEVLDILLRWFVLRFCESNTSCLLKVLEFLPELLDMLRNEGYTMTEAEAAIFLPCLIEKVAVELTGVSKMLPFVGYVVLSCHMAATNSCVHVLQSGHNIEKLREKMRELMKQIIHTYSAAKTFPFILEGLRSRNNRTRIECADLVGFLLDNYGAEISGQLKSLQIVASLTAERDGDTRKAALNTLAIGYKILGDDIWRYVGKLTEAQRSMLDDRFKWKAREMEKRKEGRPGEARAALRRSVRDNGSDPAEQSGEVSRPMNVPIFNRENYGHPEVHTDRIQMPQTYTAVGPTDWNEALDIIQLGSPEQSVEGMKVVCHELAQATADPDGNTLDDVLKDADRLVSCLANKVAKTFDFSLTGASSRSCKYVLNTLMQTFQNKRLAYAVKESTLDSLITELLLWLLDERVPQMDDGSQLLRALNVLMLKILDNADRTSSFAVLINLLRPLDPSRWPAPATNESLIIRNQKFSDLVVKCLIKLTKVLQNTIYDVDLDRILQSIHVYLQELGMDEIRKRAGADDKPLRMVKTVLHELVKLRGTAIKGHLSMVPIDMQPQPIILAYIDLNLQTLAAARMLTPSGPGGQTHWSDSTANNPAPAAHSADSQLKQELAAIFKKIGDKQTCSIGLYELYRITQLYPQVDIFSQLQNASDAFRTYIRDGLAQMERNAAAGRTPSSVPLPTPPPAALNLSPRFGPLSPVNNANPLNDSRNMNPRSDPSNFTLPPSYAENDHHVNALSSKVSGYDQLGLHQNFDESRNDRLPSGVTNGTLDAIRERMKSIQLAAGGVNPEPRSRTLVQVNGNVQNHPSAGEGQTGNLMQGGILPMDERALSGLQARMERLKSEDMRGAVLVAFAAAIGNLLQGWDNATIAGSVLYIKREFDLQSQPTIEGLIVAMSLIGATVITTFSGPVSDWLGRRPMLIISSVLYFVSGLVMLWAPNVYVLLLGRLLDGFGVGLAVTLVPVYISETAPPEIRGLLNTFPQFTGSVGMFLSYCMVFGMSLTESPSWRLMLGVLSIPSMIYFVLALLFLPESPRWLVSEMALLLEGLGVGGETSIEEYIISPDNDLADHHDHAVEKDGGIKLYGAEEGQSWIAKPVVAGQQSTLGMVSRQGSMANRSMLMDPTVALFGSVHEKLPETKSMLISNFGSMFSVPEATHGKNEHWDEETLQRDHHHDNPSDDGSGNESDDNLRSPLLSRQDTNNPGGGEQVSSGMGIGGGWQLAYKKDEKSSSGLKRIYLHQEGGAGSRRGSTISMMGGDEGGEFVHAAALVSRSVLHADDIMSHHSIEAATDVKPAKGSSSWRELCEPGVKHALFSGINGVLYYTPQILEQAGVGVLLSNLGIGSESSSFLISGLTTLLMLPSIGVAMRLMDIAGRRWLLLSTLPVLLGSLIFLVLGNVIELGQVMHAVISTVSVIVYFCCFVMGFGPIPNILCAEIFPTRVRGLCIAICALTFWIGDIIVTYSLPVMLNSVGLAGVFSMYAIVCTIAWFFVYFKVPETKGMPLEVITEFFAVGAKQNTQN